MNSISKWLWLVGSLTVVNKFFWKKKPCRLFSKDTHILSPIIFLILCKNLVRTWLLWQTNWPLGQGTFFLHVTQNMGWSYWNAYDGSIEVSYKPCLIISGLHHLGKLEHTKPTLKIGSVSKAFLFWYWQRLTKYVFSFSR